MLFLKLKLKLAESLQVASETVREDNDVLGIGLSVILLHPNRRKEEHIAKIHISCSFDFDLRLSSPLSIHFKCQPLIIFQNSAMKDTGKIKQEKGDF